jgi:sarcosine oxidase
MPARPHVVVAGLGGIGSAVALHLARGGARVTGLDTHRPPHLHGSSHGGTRILREAYFEHPLYVPLVQRALVLWHELEAAADETLFVPTGGLALGAPGSEVVRGALASARAHGLPHELLDAAELRRRFPALAVPTDQVAVFEPRAGALRVERCVAATLAAASDAGAALRFGEAVLRWEEASGDGELRVATARGELRCDRLVLVAGAWLPALLGGADAATPPLVVERAVQHWFAPRSGAELGPGNLPIFVWEHQPGRFWYGIPDLGEGLKAALHHAGELATHPSQVRRDVDASEVDGIRELLRRFLPAGDGEHRGSRVCLYTNTADLHFLVDRLPAAPRVTVVSACSGHGFKFAPALGEAVAADVLERDATFDLSPFRSRSPTRQAS